MPWLSGDKIESYELVRKCGRGAFGEVWIAIDPIKRLVALKCIDKFSRAREELNGLMTYIDMPPNPHLIAVYHIGEMDDFYYYTMELADNASENPDEYVPLTLEWIIQHQGSFSADESIELGKKMLMGLSSLHKAGLVHRDIKPSNIIYIKGEPKISDVGLVFKANVPATLIGSIGFITPERIACSGKTAYTANDDLYALGKILYCLWSGNSPEEYPALPMKCLASQRDALLNDIVKCACSNNPANRFPNDEAFAQALNSTSVLPSNNLNGDNSAAQSLNTNKSRRRKLLVGMGLFLICLVVSLVWGGHEWRKRKITAEHQHDYLVIDLSSGVNGEKYPVRWSAIPPDLTSFDCRTNEIWLKRIPAGSFMMGSPENEKYRQSNEHQHPVDIEHDFYMGIFEITQMQYYTVMGEHNSRALGDARPVEWIQYNMLRPGTNWPQDGHQLVGNNTFLARLQRRTGLRFDLPTEAEWEYACRAGTTGPFYVNGSENFDDETFFHYLCKHERFNDNRRENREGGFREHTMVGSYQPNPWGLYDMLGNVWEYCLDKYVDSPEAEPGKTPKGPVWNPTGDRVMRGGDWLSGPAECRIALRRHTKPATAYSTGGFRIVYPSDMPDLTSLVK